MGAPTRASSVARAEWAWPLTGKKASATIPYSSNVRDRDKNHRIGVNAWKKTWKRDTTSKKKKILSANTNLFSLEPLNANLNLFHGTRIIMTAKKIPFFCGHEKTHLKKKDIGNLFIKGQKKRVVE